MAVMLKLPDQELKTIYMIQWEKTTLKNRWIT